MLETTAHDYFWTVALENGALVTFTQDKIRISNSYTHSRGITNERMKEIVEPKTEKDMRPLIIKMAVLANDKFFKTGRVWDPAELDAYVEKLHDAIFGS